MTGKSCVVDGRCCGVTVAAILLLLLFPYYVGWFVSERAMFKTGLTTFFLALGSAEAAEPRTVTLGVEYMTCAACSITVRKALSLADVSESTVDMKAHTATVTFARARTTPEALATAVSHAGFPAKVLRNGR